MKPRRRAAVLGAAAVATVGLVLGGMWAFGGEGASVRLDLRVSAVSGSASILPSNVVAEVRQRMAIAGLTDADVRETASGITVTGRQSERQRLVDLTTSPGEIQIRPALDYVAYDQHFAGPAPAACVAPNHWRPDPAAQVFVCGSPEARGGRDGFVSSEARVGPAKFVAPSVRSAQAVQRGGAWACDVTLDPAVADSVARFADDQRQAHGEADIVIDGIDYMSGLSPTDSQGDLEIQPGQPSRENASDLAAILSVPLPQLLLAS